MAGAVGPDDAVILRVPSQLATLMVHILESAGHPYALEVVADPFDIFAPSAVRHPLRPFLRWWFVRSLRRQCRRALAAGYVTAETLQRRYPPGPQTRTTHYSSVELDSPVAAAPRPLATNRDSTDAGMPVALLIAYRVCPHCSTARRSCSVTVAKPIILAH